ncbi:hypothetical protein IWW38_004722 [Coemansia aciculifera]|uniref:Uncharacterized protein n=1 Tax=Coemansia aciculifera TaxID=417176 RepID=A0ACC1LXZ8_9FUNG|nr:hypothetical protein IWW38_004722 [Coemansia aciculifera]
MVIKRSNMPRIKLLGRSTDNGYEFYPIDGTMHSSGVSRHQSFSTDDESEFDGSQDEDGNEEYDTQVQHVEGVLIVRVDESLYFANAGQLHARLNRLELYGDMRVHPSEDPRMKPTRAVVFDLIGMPDIDGSALEILLNIVREYSRRQVRVAFVRVCASVRSRFEMSGMARAGGEYDFNDINTALAHLERELTISVTPTS